MRVETTLLKTEPITHTSGCHWREFLMCDDYHLNSQQLHAFYDLKQEANILFEDNNENWNLLKALYLQYFGEPIKVSGKEFLKLGFQGQYPQTDFRGGGILSLKLILRYVKRNRQTVEQMQNDKGNFFFAITAINICFFMKNYFHLSESLIPVRDKQTYCDRRALKNFCMIAASDGQAFNNMHETFLSWFYKQKWLKAVMQNSQTLMQFNKLFDEFKMKVKNVFEKNQLKTWRDFEAIWTST